MNGRSGIMTKQWICKEEMQNHNYNEVTVTLGDPEGAVMWLNDNKSLTDVSWRTNL